MSSNKGIFKKGFVSKTKGQVKKHFSQFTSSEERIILDEVGRICLDSIVESRHLSEKRNRGDVSFNMSKLIETLKYKCFSIIEFNTNDNNGSVDNRVLIRSKRKSYVSYLDNKGQEFKADSNLCFVLSLTKRQIITAYWNKCSDSHDSLNLNRYDAKINIVELLK